MWNKIRCFFRLHPYKLVLKLYTVNKDLAIPFDAKEVCKVCGKEKNHISGTMGELDLERMKNGQGKRRKRFVRT